MLFFFFFNDTATTEIYTLSLHDALPILFTTDMSRTPSVVVNQTVPRDPWGTLLTTYSPVDGASTSRDRKSTRLNSSHVEISYAVFCLKKKKKNKNTHERQDCTNSTVRHI